MKKIKVFVLNGIYSKIIEIENSIQKAVLCTIISTKGSTPRKTNTKMIVFENESIFGTIGGGALEKMIIKEAIEVLKKNESKIVSFNLVKELEMCCGGTVELFLEPIMNKKKLHIFGAGHVGKALAKFALELDFIVSLIDERIDAFDNFDLDCQKLNKHHSEAINLLPFDKNTYTVILTHDHAYDREILALCAQKQNAYLGMIGSERKIEIAKKMLLANKFLTPFEIEKVDMPIGINIHAKTPEEIAISILAKLIELRNS